MSDKLYTYPLDKLLNWILSDLKNDKIFGVAKPFFINDETNALAERINSKIKKFISSNNGTRDRDFFFFRLANYFA